jgi:hypothetical protein
MKRLMKLRKRAEKFINWGNPTMLQKHTVDPSPCLECGFCTPFGEHNLPLLVDICVSPERTKQMAEGWTIATRDGRRCKEFTDKVQAKIGDFE